MIPWDVDYDLFLGNCIDKMKLLPDESINCIVTDPPYSINYKSNGGSKHYKERLMADIDWDTDFDFAEYWEEHWRVLKQDSDAYVFGRFDNYATMTALNGFKQILIWDKAFNGMGDIYHTWRTNYEVIYYFKKGNRKINFRHNAVIRVENESAFNTRSEHPTQKPVNVLKRLIETSTDPDEIVFDGFAGSGSTGVAALACNRRFVGSEINQKYHEIASQRIKQVCAMKKIFTGESDA